MPESIDWPRMHPPKRRRRFFLLILAVVAVVFGGRTALSYYVDVFWKTRGFQWGIFTFKVFEVRCEGTDCAARP